VKRLIIVLGILLLCVSAAQGQRVKKEVIGYYPSWKWKSRNGLVSPARVPYDKLTIINYAFFAPLPDGRIIGKDNVGDSLYLRGAPGTTLPELAHAHGVKVLLSLGGWEDSDNFPAIAADPELRAAFAGSCVGAIREYGFDGIDIDWEFPGYRDHHGTPADRRHFTLLLRVLRDSLLSHVTRGGKTPLLTAAFPSGQSHASQMEVDSVAGLLDQINIMTYDFYGPWDRLAYHNSPLYPSEGGDSARSVDGALRLYHTVYAIPLSKINLGIPFYGQTYTGCTALNTPHSGPDTLHFSPSGAFYYDIFRMLDKGDRRWDGKARVPYLVSKEWNLLVSYDDELSVKAKAEYVVEKNVHGVIIWEITGDYLPDGSTPLLDALTSVFRSTDPKTE
jgi:GH18 family chitinase